MIGHEPRRTKPLASVLAWVLLAIAIAAVLVGLYTPPTRSPEPEPTRYVPRRSDRSRLFGAIGELVGVALSNLAAETPTDSLGLGIAFVVVGVALILVGQFARRTQKQSSRERG